MTAVERARSTVIPTELDVALDRPLPESIPVGRATAVFCIGACFHPRLAIEDLVIAVGGARHRPRAQRMPRLGLFNALHSTLSTAQAATFERDPQSPRDPELRSYRSGFWAMVPIEAQGRPGELELRLEARLADGTTTSAPLATITVVEPREPPSPACSPKVAGGDLIAICMATFNPDIELFRIQVDSIRAQTDQNWICIISDDCSRQESFEAVAEIVAGDERFVLSRAERHLGFYRNFERALEMAPAEAEFAALCDHDDRWYPDKLGALRGAIGSAGLAYSDSRRVDVAGNVRAETLWQNRSNNRTNLASLLIMNTIPGAACLFRRHVIDRALPFPDGPGWDFHDHWLALVAMALGEVAYVDRPLYDYVQHPGAVLGRVVSDQEQSPPPRPRLRTRLARRRGFFDRWRSAYFSMYLQRELLAEVLLARCGEDLTSRKRRALRRLIAATRSPLAFAWLAARPARELVGRNETLRVEAILVRGILWRQLVVLRIRGRPRPARSSLDASMPSVDPDSLGPRRRRWLAGK